jgi:gluconate 2-dehydrogenase gamma chain
MTEVSRRQLFRVAGAAGAAATLPVGGGPLQAAPSTPTYRFFNDDEAAIIEAAVDRLIPPDGDQPGALWASVPTYIDLQLAGAYGQGARLYGSGPWKQGSPSQGYQLPLNPSQLYREALTAIGRDAASAPFHMRSAEDKDAYLKRLEASQVPMPFPSAYFFETLLANTIEGFFSDPIYGGNRDMTGWRLIGFPGAYASYLDLYTRHGMKLDREPMSIGAPHPSSMAGHDHG